MKQQKSNLLREIFSIFFVILGSLTLSFFYLASFAHSLLFDTNYYLKIVTPLPQNTEVATAISTYTVSTLFEKGNIEEKIKNALPEQIKFLASTLANNLQNRSLSRTTQIIQSDGFSSIWVAANTVFHQRILTIVRGGGILPDVKENINDKLQNNSLQFDGSQIAQTIKDQLGSDSQLFTDEQIQQFRSVTIPTYINLQNIRQTVYLITQLAATLLPVSIALILVGIAIAFSRQKAILATGIFITMSTLTSLIALQVIKNDFLNQISDEVYNKAAGIVLQNFLSPLTQNLWLIVLAGLLLCGLALLAGDYTWAANFRKSLGIPQLQKSAFMSRFTKIRIFLARYALWLRLLGIIIAIFALFVIQNILIANVVIILSWLLIYLALLALIFPRERLNRI